MLLYSYSGCSTCRDAVAWLRAHAVSVEERPIYERPPSLAELKRMLAFQGGELRKLFNTSGLEYRALDLKTKLPTMSVEDALKLLSGNGRLVKRPFLLGANVGLVGFKPEVWAAALLPRA
ncbi:arsenate reductase family protein [Opitutus sp. ER46]|uniref:arsenate reductase family protein n=1 Tax=Opitutus sp. ER46 TaxID=2161864 RepID=UPI000D2F805A|nr:arsenate reductase family protein [Opitutus sp. ER46]PTX96604.1 ArsC family transcriptional regulator [Opitutus sp. ER46]